MTLISVEGVTSDSPAIPGRDVTGEMPRIAILTNYPLDGKTFGGGVETATAGLLEGLERYVDEFEFHVLALSRDVQRTTVEVRKGMHFHFVAIPSSWYTKPHVISNIFNIYAELKKIKPDLVHCQDNMAAAVAAIAAKPLRKLFTVHGIKAVESRVWEGPEYWSHFMDAMLERWVRQKFADVITISPYVDRFLPLHVRKHHIANPVRRMFFESPQSGVDTGSFLFVGSLTRLKRPLDVIKAFGAVKREFGGAVLRIVGKAEDAAYYKEMKEYISASGLDDVEFLGNCTQETIVAVMRQSTGLVLGSVQENTPMVIAESMASGLPVIASSVGGVPMMINDGVDGKLFDCGDVAQISRLMVSLLKDPKLRETLSRCGREKAARVYSSDAVAAATVQTYCTMLGRRNVGGS